MQKRDAGIRLYYHEMTRPMRWFEKWTPLALFQIFIYFSVCITLLLSFPNTLWDPDLQRITYTIGILGIWRYAWWFTHAVRSRIYHQVVFPRIRKKANLCWAAGTRPPHLHFMMTTYKEDKQITDQVVDSVVSQVREVGVPATIWLGSGDVSDEINISRRLRRIAGDLDLNFTIIRQNQPGKRMAIGLVLRAMKRAGIHPNDAIVFMDGDCILGPGCVVKCVTLFQSDPELQAVTTDEEVIAYGADWVRRWLTMRFAQRRIAMGSHALSSKVLTLTGRMSVFRARHVTNPALIRLLEADYLDHWLWGRFRFLSGDDKSTWYYMLLQNAKMLYVPDACVYTVEHIEGNGLDRMKENFRRWSGNMLRNGARAIALGPRKVGWFIWWCVVDQRLAMWTMLVSPVLAFLASWLHSPAYLISYTVFILITRMMLSLVLYSFNREVDIAYPFILYFNQLFNAAVKVYCLFHLSKQKWSNRGNQSSKDGQGWLEIYRSAFAKYVMVVYLALLVLAILVYSELVNVPSVAYAQRLFVG